ncbi:hypothetical protein N185_16625 [Sinorhizobium sp. GW3]|nr:hypothetical protein N185_16625 [Sinorhizobium sp. GW3]
MRTAATRLALPLTIKVPMLVATLMIIISAIISHQVLKRLKDTQEQQLRSVVSAYIDGLSNALMPSVLQNDIWETYNILDRRPPGSATLPPTETIVTGRDGRVLASTDPKTVPPLSELPSKYRAANSVNTSVEVPWEERQGYGARSLIYQGRTIGAIHASFDIGHFIDERTEIFWTLVITNAALATAFAAFGYLITRHMVGPVKVLTDHMRSGASGTPNTIAREEFPRPDSEFAQLFEGFNALVEAERERGALKMRLANEEKLASLGLLVSSMAHEINNPLGGLLNTIDTLKRYGADRDVRFDGLQLLERGLAGIRDVVSAALITYRPERTNRPLTLKDLEDVRLLAGPEIALRRQHLSWQGCPLAIALPSTSGHAVRRALLNLVLNASAAAGDGGMVSVTIGADDGQTLTITVADTGTGLPLSSVFVLTSATPGSAVRAGTGLGLWMIRQTVDDAGGEILVTSQPDSGTEISLVLPLEKDQSNGST